jgi:hypothetical protein
MAGRALSLALDAAQTAALLGADPDVRDSDDDGPGDVDDRASTWASFVDLREFFRRAADAHRAIVFTLAG